MKKVNRCLIVIGGQLPCGRHWGALMVNCPAGVNRSIGVIKRREAMTTNDAKQMTINDNSLNDKI